MNKVGAPLRAFVRGASGDLMAATTEKKSEEELRPTKLEKSMETEKGPLELEAALHSSDEEESCSGASNPAGATTVYVSTVRAATLMTRSSATCLRRTSSGWRLARRRLRGRKCARRSAATADEAVNGCFSKRWSTGCLLTSESTTRSDLRSELRDQKSLSKDLKD